ncbi:MAG: Cobalamin import ATP-binding protein BtuD [Methanocella sp. PtaU1.Bin125]|nr:MAG: Cobalamin import ATP-binding protein BtuD [Methanocella sp. PtaU1.Bin125]
MEMEMEDVCVDYDRHRAVDRVSFAVGPGEIVALVGPNGSGKSTLIKAIAGIVRPSSGRISLDGRDVRDMRLTELARLIGYVPQSVPMTYHATVVDAVLLGRKPYIRWGVSRGDIAIVRRAMAAMGIESLSGKLMGQLSGGERQKVIIARALAQEPALFLFDEPTNNLDLKHQVEVLEMARRLADEKGIPALMALHDLNLAFTYSDRVVMLAKGRVRASGAPSDVLTACNIREIYGVDVTVHDWGQGRFIVPARAPAIAAGRGGP